jgi:hypothetical protein
MALRRRPAENRRSLGFAWDDKKERVVARRGRSLKEKPVAEAEDSG